MNDLFAIIPPTQHVAEVAHPLTSDGDAALPTSACTQEEGSCSIFKNRKTVVVVPYRNRAAALTLLVSVLTQNDHETDFQTSSPFERPTMSPLSSFSLTTNLSRRLIVWLLCVRGVL
jgi:hypothetical protein